LSKHESVIDLDINELAALLLSQGDGGRDAIISLLDESFTSLGPLSNLLVQNAMSFEDRTAEYQLPRNYTGNILKNNLIAGKVERLGTEIMTDRGLIDEGEFTNPIILAIAQVLSNPHRVIHNFTMLAEYTRKDFVHRLAQRLGAEAAEQSVPQTPPNGISYPVTAYAATIISTERGGVVIAPNDFNAMLFDLQLIPAMPVGSFIKELIVVADETTPKSSARTIVYGIKIPGGTEINAAAFSDTSGNWSVPFKSPEDDIEYVPLVDAEGNVLASEVAVAVNKTDLLDASALRGTFDLPDLDSTGDYIARLSTVPLARRAETNETEDSP